MRKKELDECANRRFVGLPCCGEVQCANAGLRVRIVRIRAAFQEIADELQKISTGIDAYDGRKRSTEIFVSSARREPVVEHRPNRSGVFARDGVEVRSDPLGRDLR
jgi:hypothetical protein